MSQPDKSKSQLDVKLSLVRLAALAYLPAAP
jgi:hypothetical protein